MIARARDAERRLRYQWPWWKLRPCRCGAEWADHAMETVECPHYEPIADAELAAWERGDTRAGG